MPKIGPSDLGQLVHPDYQPSKAVKYHNNQNNTTTKVYKPFGKLVGLSQMTRDPITGQSQEATSMAEWKDCSSSVRAELKGKFNIVSPPIRSNRIERRGTYPMPSLPPQYVPPSIQPSAVQHANSLPKSHVRTIEDRRPTASPNVDDAVMQLNATGWLAPQHNAEVQKYIKHVVEKAGVNSVTLKLAISYLDSVGRKETHIEKKKKYVTYNFAGAVMLAHKYINDTSYSLSDWSQVTRFSKTDLIAIERYILTNLDHNLNFKMA